VVKRCCPPLNQRELAIRREGVVFSNRNFKGHKFAGARQSHREDQQA
jgi:hypothetical protein